MIKKINVVSIISLLMTGCTGSYNHTINVCTNNLYVEVFNVTSAGVDSHYLTDSVNFRMFVGKIQSEYEQFSYRCINDDSITITKLEQKDSSGYYDIIETKAYNLTSLKKKKVFQ